MNAFAYLVRREFWENKSLYIAPLMLAGIVLLAFTFGNVTMDHPAEVSEAAVHEIEMLKRFGPLIIAMVFFVVMFIVIIFYLLDSLYTDRRDRSILFWKSLPVSDTEVVLSKLSIALLYFPFVVLVVSVLTTVLGIEIASLRTDRASWSGIPVLDSSLVIAYALFAQSLWYFPIFAYLLLVSAWARRAVFLWAVLPLIGVTFAEHVLFRTEYFAELIAARLTAWFPLIFVVSDEGHVVKGHEKYDTTISLGELIDPTPMFTSPGLWLGLAVGAAFVAGAVWLRRYRDET